MRALKALVVGLILFYVLLFVAIAAAWAIDQGLFRVARLVSPETAAGITNLVVGSVALAIVGSVALLLVPRMHRARSWRRGVSTGATVLTGGLAIALAVNGFPTISRTIVSEENSAAAAAVARPACRGFAIAEAGRLITGTTVNHVVVLDTEGNDHSWTGSPPETWRPASIGDLELLLCVDRDETTFVDQVCPYSGGPDVTRHTAVRNVRIVEPATGRTLATLKVEDEARSCQKTEEASLTDLWGSVEWPDVQAKVAEWLAAHDAASGSVD